MIAIRAPHGRRSRSVKVAKSHKSSLETGLLVLAWIGFFIPLIWLASSVLSFADDLLSLGPLVAGVICFVAGLWLSAGRTLILARIGRSPWRCVNSIDSSRKACIAGSAIRCTRRRAVFLGRCAGHPNWAAGPSNLVAFGILFMLRVHAEEQMMSDAFGDEYATYAARTKRIVPGVWVTRAG